LQATDARDYFSQSDEVALPGAESAVYDCLVTAKFHYTGPTGPDQTKSADFVSETGADPADFAGDPHKPGGLCQTPARTQLTLSETSSGPSSGIWLLLLCEYRRHATVSIPSCCSVGGRLMTLC